MKKFIIGIVFLSLIPTCSWANEYKTAIDKYFEKQDLKYIITDGEVDSETLYMKKIQNKLAIVDKIILEYGNKKVFKQYEDFFYYYQQKSLLKINELQDLMKEETDANYYGSVSTSQQSPFGN